MAKLLWALTCQRILTDQETNSVSYIEAIEQLGVPRLPFVFPPVTVGSLWKREKLDEKILVRLSLRDPSGKKVADFEPEPTEATAPRHRLNVMLAGLPIKEAGEHCIVVEQKVSGKWRKETTLPIDVKLVTDPE